MEVLEKFFERAEAVFFFAFTNVTVIPFASLVVLAHSTHACSAKVEPILVQVGTWRKRLRKFPDHNFDDASIVTNFLGSDDRAGAHILHCSNIR